MELLARVVFGMMDSNGVVDAEAVRAAGDAQSVAPNPRTSTLGEKFVGWLQRDSMVRARWHCCTWAVSLQCYSVTHVPCKVFFMSQAKMTELLYMLQYGNQARL